jgi:hypothetical protein
VLSAPTQDAEDERVVADVEEDLRLGADLASPGLLEVSMPRPQPLVPTVYGADSRETGVELDIGIEEGNERLYVTRVVCLDCSAEAIDVFARHPSFSIRYRYARWLLHKPPARPLDRF